MKVILEEYLQGIAAAGERIERCEMGMRDLLEKWRLAPAVRGPGLHPLDGGPEHRPDAGREPHRQRPPERDSPGAHQWIGATGICRDRT